MTLNSYAVLDLSLSLLRLAVALGVVALGVRAVRAGRRPTPPDAKDDAEDRSYLLALLGLLLLALNLVAWPLLYLLLQSYVAETPGVMCVYGVTRIGSGSAGPERFLPGLLTALQVAKPAAVFVSGVWLTLYLLNRRTQSAPLTGRAAAVLLALGLLGVADATAELAYLVIPKHEADRSQGCCTAVFDDPSHGVWIAPDAVLGLGDRSGLSAAYFAANVVMVSALSGYAARVRRRGRAPTLTPLLVAAFVTVPVTVAFVVEVAAPVLLRLPYHHCPYDLIPEAPEVVLAGVLFAWATFSVGWASAAAGWGDCPETRPCLAGPVEGLLLMGLFCYLGSVIMMTIELLMA
jgi:hypothetical protein